MKYSKAELWNPGKKKGRSKTTPTSTKYILSKYWVVQSEFEPRVGRTLAEFKVHQDLYLLPTLPYPQWTQLTTTRRENLCLSLPWLMLRTLGVDPLKFEHVALEWTSGWGHWADRFIRWEETKLKKQKHKKKSHFLLRNYISILPHTLIRLCVFRTQANKQKTTRIVCVI